MIYYLIAVGYISITWHNIFPLLLVWINFILFIVWVFMKIFEKKAEKFVMFGMLFVNMIVIICAMAKTNTS